jgi:hypothetical protein
MGILERDDGGGGMKRGIWKGGRLGRWSRGGLEDWRSEGVEEQKTGRLNEFGGMEELRRKKWRAGRGEKQRWKNRKCMEDESIVNGESIAVDEEGHPSLPLVMLQVRYQLSPLPPPPCCFYCMQYVHSRAPMHITHSLAKHSQHDSCYMSRV